MVSPAENQSQIFAEKKQAFKLKIIRRVSELLGLPSEFTSLNEGASAIRVAIQTHPWQGELIQQFVEQAIADVKAESDLHDAPYPEEDIMSEYSHDFSMPDESDMAQLRCDSDDQRSSRSHFLPDLGLESGLKAARKHLKSLTIQVIPYSERCQSEQPDTGC